jgi:two-component system sensor histidine kinase BaeS
MPEHGRGPGSRPRWRGEGTGGFRPPWWPEGEPFGPPRPAAWRGMRRHFLRRVGLVLVLFFGLAFAASALAVAVFSDAWGPRRHPGLALPGRLIGLALLVGVFVAVGRGVRRMAGPVGEVMEAADRVAAGDYSIRVEERGTRELRRLARSFNAMTERLRSNEEQRRNLLADLAHELRTPLTVIQGSTEGMLDGIHPPDRSHLQPLLDETKVMARLLDDLQILSTAEAGALQLHRELVDPGALVEDAAAAMRARVEAAGLRLELRVASGLPDLEVDPVRIGEVLANLLSNAVRHTPAGGSVVVSVEPGEDGRRVAFEVQDTGSGIAPEALPYVFDRFVKAGDSGGAGLGLAIARTLVEAHGGEITARSRPGGGTTMRFVLPTAVGGKAM